MPGWLALWFGYQSNDFSAVPFEVKHVVLLPDLVTARVPPGIHAHTAFFGVPLSGVTVISCINEEITVFIELPAPGVALGGVYRKHLVRQCRSQRFLRQRLSALWVCGDYLRHGTCAEGHRSGRYQQ